MEEIVKTKLKPPKYLFLINLLWACLLLLTIIFTFTSTEKKKNRYYDLQIEAATKIEAAFKCIKEEKIKLGKDLSDVDKLETYLIGVNKKTKITTTEGDLSAKRTSVNPNFGAVYIDMFREASLKPGDEIAIMTSGSFPALNIAATISAEVYGLKVCNMTGIGASRFGATDPDFTYFDMTQLLVEKGFYENQIDYVSFGGGFDDGSEFNEEVRNAILERIEKSGVDFLCEPDYEKNIEDRIEKIYEKCPHLKLFLNVGGTIMAMGNGYTVATTYRGLVKPNYLSHTLSKTDPSIKGLLETFHEANLPVIQMLNITKIAYEYGMPKDPDVIPTIGEDCSAYYETRYNLVFPVLSLIISTGILGFYFFIRKKYYL